MSLKVDLEFLVGSRREHQTNFSTRLFELILKADGINLELIRKGFPNAVKTVEIWRATGEIIDLPYDS